ncbi:radical SAM protein [Vibrio artabrorum]|uniref:radical SAM protein n=1 Tax=Vibrio artabrorum TaxID=446374 RepID=UPI0035506C7D
MKTVDKIIKVSNVGLRLTKFLLKTNVFKQTGEKRSYPKVVQLPLTYECDSKCVMCNIWNMDHSGEASAEEFSHFMKDPIFSKVEAIGINGGEISLVKDFNSYVDEILKLPELKHLNVISNGFRKDVLLSNCQKIYEKCKSKGISFHIALSLDGYEDVHNEVRGVRNAFTKVMSTLNEIKDNKNKYCDSYDVGCTVINQNVSYLMQLDEFCKSEDINIKYRMGIENERIESNLLTKNFSVLLNDKMQSAAEFFHMKYMETPLSSLPIKFKYFSIFYYLTKKDSKRLLGCYWKENGITLDSRGEIYYCAVKSKSLGSLRNSSGESVFFDEENIAYRKGIIENDCDNCIHDYHGVPEATNVLIFYKDMLKEFMAIRLYALKVRWLR